MYGKAGLAARHYAAKIGRTIAVKWLLERGADAAMGVLHFTLRGLAGMSWWRGF